MRSHRARAALVILLLAHPLSAADSTKSLADNPGVASAIQVFDAWVARTAADREQPAVSIGLVYDQNLIWAKGYGFADLEKKTRATPATAYRIASLSKLFTATAILQLRDAGKLQLDDPVSKWLPEFAPGRVETGSPVITVRHLLTHTSGLPREVEGTYWNDMKFPSREEMERVLNRMGVVGPPETEWKYSNVALSLAGYVVEKASGQPYAEYVAIQTLSVSRKPTTLDHTEAAAVADKRGIGFARAATAGVDPRFVAMVRQLLLERADLERGGDPERPAVGAWAASWDVCPAGCCANPRGLRPAVAGHD